MLQRNSVWPHWLPLSKSLFWVSIISVAASQMIRGQQILHIGGVFHSADFRQVFEDAIYEFNVEKNLSCPQRSGFVLKPFPLILKRQNVSFLERFHEFCNGFIRNGIHLVFFCQDSLDISFLSYLADQISVPSINTFPARSHLFEVTDFCEVSKNLMFHWILPNILRVWFLDWINVTRHVHLTLELHLTKCGLSQVLLLCFLIFSDDNGLSGTLQSHKHSQISRRN